MIYTSSIREVKQQISKVNLPVEALERLDELFVQWRNINDEYDSICEKCVKLRSQRTVYPDSSSHVNEQIAIQQMNEQRRKTLKYLDYRANMCKDNGARTILDMEYVIKLCKLS